MLFGKIFYMIHRTISVRFLRDTIRDPKFLLLAGILFLEDVYKVAGSSQQFWTFGIGQLKL